MANVACGSSRVLSHVSLHTQLGQTGPLAVLESLIFGTSRGGRSHGPGLDPEVEFWMDPFGCGPE